MRRLAAVLTMLALLVITCAPAATGAEALPNVSRPMLAADYWINNTARPDQLILSSADIALFNKRIIADLPGVAFDLAAYPATLDRPTLSSLLSAAQFPRGAAYVSGLPASAAFRENCQRSINPAAVKDANPVRYGLTVRRTDIRTFPTLSGVFDSPGDRDFDRFQETAVDPAEPVLILHESLDKDFYFIQMRNYRGWVPVQDIALAKTRQQWLDYMTAGDFLVVTSSTLGIGRDPATGGPLLFQMGAKIPVVRAESTGAGLSYLLKVPVRTVDGVLAFRTELVPASADVHRGYLPYTRANTIRQAFRMLGDPYGWGGLADSVDCSSFIANIFRTMGFLLPRNADEQESAPGLKLALAGKSAAERLTLLQQLPPGSPVFMNGHVMLYLGQSGGKPYIIHSLGSYSRKDPATGRLQRVPVMRVVVSDLGLLLSSNRTFLDALNGGTDYR